MVGRCRLAGYKRSPVSSRIHHSSTPQLYNFQFDYGRRNRTSSTQPNTAQHDNARMATTGTSSLSSNFINAGDPERMWQPRTGQRHRERTTGGGDQDMSDIRDLPLEIQLAFYPPPNIIVPELNIPGLKKYEYKFDQERTAILRYKQEQMRLVEEATSRIKAKEEEEAAGMIHREEEHGAATITETTTNSNGPASSATDDENFTMGIGQIAINSEEVPPSPISIVVMQSQNADQTKRTTESSKTPSQLNWPSPPQNATTSNNNRGGVDEGGTSMPSSISQQPQTNGVATTAGQALPPPNAWPKPWQSSIATSSRNTLNSGLEEFEVKRDLFDFVELQSVDDRRELEKLLFNHCGPCQGTPPAQSTVPNGGTHPFGNANSLPLLPSSTSATSANVIARR